MPLPSFCEGDGILLCATAVRLAGKDNADAVATLRAIAVGFASDFSPLLMI